MGAVVLTQLPKGFELQGIVALWNYGSSGVMDDVRGSEKWMNHFLIWRWRWNFFTKAERIAAMKTAFMNFFMNLNMGPFTIRILTINI